MGADVTLLASPYLPFALGFFGLGTGYLIYGPQELFGYPPRDASVDRSVGVWGIWLPGFCQFVTGVLLFVGMTWFQVFREGPVYMAALAFSAYGIHWFAIGWNRYQGNDPRPNAGMCIAYMVISALGATVFFQADDIPVFILFVGLFLVYFADFFASLAIELGERALGLFHTLTGVWLMYLTFAATVNFSLGYHWWL
ncbi:hypothetical protein [Flexivirga sp.]|uniref:hypothetical protein n=1 Tax=Flexivirga sp. TaxID=1962927 RepID=UPI003F7D6795